MEPPFEKLDGVDDVISGYTGGTTVNPTYKEVSSDTTGHIESVRFSYDPEVVSYEKLLDVFWRQINPTDDGGQFVDRGSSYVTAIFYHTEEQKRLAEESKAALERSGRFDGPIVTPIRPAVTFYEAEDYHQDYYKKRPLRYKIYRSGSGRDRFLKKAWKEDMMSGTSGSTTRWADFVKPSDEELQKALTPLQYKVTQHEGTERAFTSEMHDSKAQGIYVDIVSGEPLFSSTDKYDSRSGWPSFYKPLEPGLILERQDNKLFTSRTEVRSRYGDSHLGHVFGDGPQPTGLRYCINGAALRFVPKEDLDKEGYGEYTTLFK